MPLHHQGELASTCKGDISLELGRRVMCANTEFTSQDFTAACQCKNTSYSSEWDCCTAGNSRNFSDVLFLGILLFINIFRQYVFAFFRCPCKGASNSGIQYNIPKEMIISSSTVRLPNEYQCQQRVPGNQNTSVILMCPASIQENIKNYMFLCMLHGIEKARVRVLGRVGILVVLWLQMKVPMTFYFWRACNILSWNVSQNVYKFSHVLGVEPFFSISAGCFDYWRTLWVCYRLLSDLRSQGLGG